MSATDRGPLERDTVVDLVWPLLLRAGWRTDQIAREYYVRARTAIASEGATRRTGYGFADLVLEATPGTPVAAVEAKRQYKTAEDAIQQAIRYAEKIDAPLAFGTNGTRIIMRNLRTGTEEHIEHFPSPAWAWGEYLAANGLDTAGGDLIGVPYNRARRSVEGHIVEPRPYQVSAINRTLASIARGERRVLLLMATGTGKTFTAMQIVSKLRAYRAVVDPDRNFRVLYLADRDALLDQPMRKDFRPAFGSDPLLRVRGETDLSREIYFASYQSLTGHGDGARLPDFRADFFDLVIVDECHRGSADENSRWRAVLDHFSSAIHLGLTATPRDDRVQSYEYFGNPVFEYSLRDGIEDGYLAPYRVRRVTLTPDAEGWEPTPGQRDRFGQEIPTDLYETRDFERVVSLLARTRLAARHLSRVLRSHPCPRAIVFCVDTEHASDMRRALIEENPDRVRDDPDWVVRIVGVEGERQRLLEDFCDPTRLSPAIATTSRLLSTGVDVEDLTHVVLFRGVGSMIEFKQIIGRGTRLYPEKGKSNFEIVDYVGASAQFNDPSFDGYPAHLSVELIDRDGSVSSIDESSGDEDPAVASDDEIPPPRDPEANAAPGTNTNEVDMRDRMPHHKYYIDDGEFAVESETQLVPDTSSGRLVLTEYGALVRDRIRAMGDADELRRAWSNASSRARMRAALEDGGVDVDELVVATGVADIDPLDALYHLAWNLPTRTRSERANRVRETRAAELSGLEARARGVLEGLLQRYETHGIGELETPEVFRLRPLSDLGSVAELARASGGPERLRGQLDLVQQWLYSA